MHQPARDRTPIATKWPRASRVALAPSFDEENQRINLQRLPLGLMVLAAVHLVHVIAFLPPMIHDGSRADRWLGAIGTAHAVMLAVALVGTGLARHAQKSPARWRHLPIVMAALYLAFSALLTGFDQLAAPTPIAFFIGSIGLAIFFRWRLGESIVVFLLGAVLAIVLTESWQSDPELRRSVQVNCGSVAAIALLITRSSARLHHKIWDDRRVILLHARTDSLTGVLTRRAFLELVREALAEEGGRGAIASVVLIDIDDLKTINDGSGHAAGDAAIVAVSDAMRACTDERAVLGRLGGDEFCILLPDAGSAAALVVAERLRAATEQLGTTVSVGVATSSPAESAERWLARADAAMYGAKSGGRNRVRLGA